MDSYYRPTWVEISLDALRHNYKEFRKAIPQAMKIMAVVKANGYGHGAKEVAWEALDCGADYLGVAFMDEAIELRRSGITAPILVLGYTSPEGVDLALTHDITITVFSEELLDYLEDFKNVIRPGTERALKIHIKLDTGMGRLGLRVEPNISEGSRENEGQEAILFIERALKLEGVVVEGLFTHYACADETDNSYTYAQYERFGGVVEYFRAKDITFPLVHAGNSATAIQFPGLSYTMVRLGISLYGLYPSEEVNRQEVQLLPVMSFKTAVIMAKILPPHSGVSYGAIYHTSGDEQIATLPVGYADGYTRMLTGRGEVLIRGQKVPIVGRICMDQCMINVSGLPSVEVGEEVVLFGRQGDAVITADDLAKQLGTINYEITCMVSNRVPRTYIRDGQIIDVVNPLFGGAG
ncbi:MAG TPA: alanine racemase [Bacilli bacterium]